MGVVKIRLAGALLGVWTSLIAAHFTQAEKAGFSHRNFRAPAHHLPEAQRISIRHPSELPRAKIPRVPAPATVSRPSKPEADMRLSLDEAIRAALANTNVVRVLAGLTAVSSGRTIYDAAIVSTGIDQAQSRFDPELQADNSWNRIETPQDVFDPLDLSRAQITGQRTDDYNLRFGLTDPTITGGTVGVTANTNPSRFEPGLFPLNPRNRSSVELSVTQPLLQGAGVGPNLAPIIVARIDTERSFFQFKDAVQDLVFGVIDAYWALVFARTDVWAREQQVEQAEFAYDRAQARKRIGSDNIGDVAQAQVSLANFRASLVTARANQLNQEAALRNILGFPPDSLSRIIPTTPPSNDHFDFQWHELVALAEQQRTDLIELKLIIEADLQLLAQSQNQALPRVDALALYRWNGLEGEMPVGTRISTHPGDFADWTLAVNFSVPLGLRRARAELRQQQLVVARDRSNLQQGLHQALHELALSVRSLDQFFAQYEAFRQARAAADSNLQLQFSRYHTGTEIFLVVLQAITDWGNAVSSEAQALAQFNTELANLDRGTGTILETHGVRFFEERYGTIGPLSRLHRVECFPESLRPTSNSDRYPSGDEPAENFFELKKPERSHRRIQPPPEPIPSP